MGDRVRWWEIEDDCPDIIIRYYGDAAGGVTGVVIPHDVKTAVLASRWTERPHP